MASMHLRKCARSSLRSGASMVFCSSAAAGITPSSASSPLVVICTASDGSYAVQHLAAGSYDVAFAPLTALLVVQVTPARDSFVPITMAAIDRRLDQITANAAIPTGRLT